MERSIRRQEEEFLCLHDFATLDEANQVLGVFIERYNGDWFFERHGHRTPQWSERAFYCLAERSAKRPTCPRKPRPVHAKN